MNKNDTNFFAPNRLLPIIGRKYEKFFHRQLGEWHALFQVSKFLKPIFICLQAVKYQEFSLWKIIDVSVCEWKCLFLVKIVFTNICSGDVTAGIEIDAYKFSLRVNFKQFSLENFTLEWSVQTTLNVANSNLAHKSWRVVVLYGLCISKCLENGICL